VNDLWFQVPLWVTKVRDDAEGELLVIKADTGKGRFDDEDLVSAAHLWHMGYMRYNDIKVAAQRQDSLNDQLKDLAVIATKHGMYDAADLVKSLVARIESPDRVSAEEELLAAKKAIIFFGEKTGAVVKGYESDE